MAEKQTGTFSPGNLGWMQKSDILVGIGIITVVSMLVIPLPTFLLDFFLSVSIMLSLLILMIVMFVKKSYEFSIFPSLLLITTVFRLALNVSSTRLILLQGASFDGQIIRSFGSFVVGGNYVVGLIVFIILIAVQVMVITKGATRTSEVAARFTLDALPGKQMSIDSDLANGHITEDEARKRRADVRLEADFYGAMDGASKFVQGDVRVGIIITIINILGGFIIGMVLRNESFDVAVDTYLLLAVGDGLVSQIPSLLVTTATGILVTRAVSDNNMGTQMKEQLSSQPRALYITAAALGAAMFVPGFPTIPLFLLSAGLGALGYILNKAQKTEMAEQERKQGETMMKERKADTTAPPPVDILAVEIGYNLIPLVDPEQGGSLLERITNIRRRSAIDMGMIVPPIRIRDNMELEPQAYSILIRGVEVGSGMLQVGKLMAMDSGVVEAKIEGDEFTEPVFGLNAIWIDIDRQSVAESRGYSVVDCPSIVATHLTEIIKKHADEMMGMQEVRQLIDNLRNDYAVVVNEVESKKVSLRSIQKVLQNLLREQVSIRNMLTIMETIASYGDERTDPDLLTEYVRIALAREITSGYIDQKTRKLNVISVDPEIEAALRNSLYDDPVEGKVLALDPETASVVERSLLDAYSKAMNLKYMPVFLVSPQIRSVVFALLERKLPSPPAVLAYNELNRDVNINVVASALLPSAV